MGLLDSFSSSKGKQAAAQANAATTAGFRSGYDKAAGLYDQGLAGATTQYNKASDLFDQWYTTGSKANQAYGDAMGLNGQAGRDAAVKSFQTSPGYDFAMNSGLDAIDRRAASRGMLGSGNTNADSISYSQGLANQEWQNYLNNLNTASNGGQSAAQSQASQLDQLATAINNNGVQKGNLAYQTETGIGNSNAQMIKDQFAAQQSANQNLWNGLFQVGGLAASIAGGGLPSFGGNATTSGWSPVVTKY